MTTSAPRDPRLIHGETLIFERVTMLDGVRKLVERGEAAALYRDGLARPERRYVPSIAAPGAENRTQPGSEDDR